MPTPKTQKCYFLEEPTEILQSAFGYWLPGQAQWQKNCMNYLIFCNFRLQLCISCIFSCISSLRLSVCLSVCLSVFVCLLCSGRMKIVFKTLKPKNLLKSLKAYAFLSKTQFFSFIHILLLVQQLTKRNFARELKQNETVTGLKRKLMKCI